jgi:hypothetical protein
VRERTGRILVGIGAVLFLLPLTVVTGLMVMLSYPAYPIPDPGVLQIVFDGAMLMKIVAILAGWWLAASYLAGGPRRLAGAHGAWLVLLGLGAVIGLVGAGFAIQHLLTPRTAGDHVGFALLAPGVLLVPIWVFLWRQRQ